MILKPRIQPCLWFDSQAEEAAAFYVDIFENSRIINISRYSDAGYAIHKMLPGSVMAVTFALDGQMFTALNGGNAFKFNEAISLQINCDTQQEVDFYWDRLSDGGDERAQQCGWLKDKFGLSWQVVPGILITLINDPDPQTSQRAMNAMLTMKKIEIAELQRALEN